MENGDGTSTLMIAVYPFYYKPSTTDVRFYKNYSFDIQVISRTVEIVSLSTSQDAYPPDENVVVDIELNSPGQVQDVIVSAAVQASSLGEVVEGLPLRALKSLTGTAYFSAQWDGSSFEPGRYRVQVEIKDTAGNVLDRETTQFELGIHAAQVTNLAVTPTMFEIGQAASISLVFSNTGTVPLTGTAIIKVQDQGGAIVETFSHQVAGLAPANSLNLEDDWDTTGIAAGSYQVAGYVLYDSRSTNPAFATVLAVAPGGGYQIYLPLVLKH
jgi:hypothetical protein